MAEAIPEGGDALLRPRDYQLEMLQDSLRRNIIVAMDTGSGKTHIAVLRIALELERCSPDKRVWFLCPKVGLAQQQHRVISKQLPAYPTKLLLGKDGCDFWSTQSIWDEVLFNIRIVVCTHDILCNALTHAFVRMDEIALLVFDEAHYCRSNHAANRIMQNFYHPTRLKGEPVPHVLGLTASPIFNDGIEGLQIIERNLDSICRTPRLHREELFKFVHRPELLLRSYEGKTYPESDAFWLLNRKFHSIEIENDPWVKHLRQSLVCDPVKLQKAYLDRKTDCQEQLKSLVVSASTIDTELGGWASEAYIKYCINNYKKAKSCMTVYSTSLEEEEAAYLADFLTAVGNGLSSSCTEPGPHSVSAKFNALLDILLSEAGPDFSGIVFATTRVAVCMLKRLIQSHPLTRDLFRVGASVGGSTNPKKRAKLSDSITSDKDNEELEDVLSDLRSGAKNLLISTTVVEEGIDITACNTVICFDQPKNLVSFIQRRGRARSFKSKYYVMLSSLEKVTGIGKWGEMEERMKEKYMDEMRELERIEHLEADDDGHREFEVASTGAKLTLHDAVPHLHHFCNTLPRVQYASLDPIYITEGLASEESVSCRVQLPNCVDTSVREFASLQMWKSERFAKMDAAYEAYMGLYRAGLINDNLLPYTRLQEEEEIYRKIEKRPNMVSVNQVLDPWRSVAAAWGPGVQAFQTAITILNGGTVQFEARMFLPCTMTHLENFILYYDAETQLEVRFGQSLGYYEEPIEHLQACTKALLFSAFRTRMVWDRDGFPILFTPRQKLTESWIDESRKSYAAQKLISQPDDSFKEKGVIRDEYGRPHLFDSVVTMDEQLPGNESLLCSARLQTVRFSKRTDYLHPVAADAMEKATAPVLLDPKLCTVDVLPASYTRLATFIPSIMRKVRNALIVEDLCSNLLSPVGFTDKSLVLTAISAPAARESTDYQKLEFLGDALLKYYTAVTLAAEHPTYHEGYLAHLKDRVVSNKALAVASINAGLDRYIIRQAFQSSKWRPSYNEDILARPPSTQEELSTKMLADVIESLIGAAYLDAGEARIMDCLKTLLPKTPWQPLSNRHATLIDAVPSIESPNQPSQLICHLQELTSYSFAHPALALEAITHPSCLAPGSPSYQRLEFVGDAVLDFIVTQMIYNHADPPLPTPRMHLLRSAAVNADFLAYLAMAYSLSVPTTEIVPLSVPSSPFASPRKPQFTMNTGPPHITTPSSKPINIFSLMRRAPSPALTTALSATQSRFEALQPTISHSLTSGTTYPWTSLAALAPEKLISDLVESTLGAIYVDSSGDIGACETWLENLGVLPWLRRALREEEMKVWHPKEEVGVLGSRLTRSEKGKGLEYVVSIKKEGGGEEVVAKGREDQEGEDEEKGGEEAQAEEDKRPVDVYGGRYLCRLKVGGEEISAARGASRKIAETRAADAAVPVLRARLEAREGSKGMVEVEAEVGVEEVSTGSESAGDSTVVANGSEHSPSQNDMDNGVENEDEREGGQNEMQDEPQDVRMEDDTPPVEADPLSTTLRTGMDAGSPPQTRPEPPSPPRTTSFSSDVSPRKRKYGDDREEEDGSERGEGSEYWSCEDEGRAMA